MFGALIMGFLLTSCGDSTKDQAIKIIDQYFKEAEDQLALIDNVEDFVTFAEIMNDRSDLLERLSDQVGDKSISDEDMKAVEDYSYERATAYNKAEGLKCTEFLAPAIDRYENIINVMYPLFQSGVEFDQETIDEFLDAYTTVTDFSVCENIDPELNERLNPLVEKEEEMSDAILARLEYFYPEEEDE